MKYTIDAQGKKLGRIASEAASLLRGKGLASFAPHELPDVSVEITNASKVALAEKKLTNVKYLRYSGYPGGLKETSMKEFLNKKGFGELFRRTVLRMLPRNTLRAKLIKRLVVKS
jgi:large subunit ribosomal protein L13